MTIWNHKKDENGNWIVTKDDKKIIDVPNQALGEELELIFAEIEEEYLNELNKVNIAMQASMKVAEYYQTLISNTLSDKLNDIDNIYALLYEKNVRRNGRRFWRFNWEIRKSWR